MKGTLITTEDDEIPILLDDLGPEFKIQQKTELGEARILSGNNVTEFVVLYDHLGFTKKLRMNTVCSILSQRDIRGHAVIVNYDEYREWIKS